MARVFVTGSADGLGKMAAGLLIEKGHKVVLHARSAATRPGKRSPAGEDGGRPASTLRRQQPGAVHPDYPNHDAEAAGVHEHFGGRPPSGQGRGVHYRSMAEFPSDRRLAVLRSRRQVRAGDWREHMHADGFLSQRRTGAGGYPCANRGRSEIRSRSSAESTAAHRGSPAWCTAPDARCSAYQDRAQEDEDRKGARPPENGCQPTRISALPFNLVTQSVGTSF
jgi:hypothetical protein